MKLAARVEIALILKLIVTLRKFIQKILDKSYTDAAETCDSLLSHLDGMVESIQKQIQKQQLALDAEPLDVDTVTHLPNHGIEMDQETINAAFWSIVHAIDTAEAKELPISANVTVMLHHIFDSDQYHLRQREKANYQCDMYAT